MQLRDADCETLVEKLVRHHVPVLHARRQRREDARRTEPQHGKP
jgi:hypothetical protein